MFVLAAHSDMTLFPRSGPLLIFKGKLLKDETSRAQFSLQTEAQLRSCVCVNVKNLVSSVFNTEQLQERQLNNLYLNTNSDTGTELLLDISDLLTSHLLSHFVFNQ